MSTESELDRPDADIVAAWHRYQLTRHEEDFWAVDIFHNIVPKDPTRAWSLIIDLVAASPEESLGAIGAGPLEDFVVAHGNDWIDKIHTEARSNPAFRESISRIWINRGALSQEAEARLVALSEGRIQPLDP